MFAEPHPQKFLHCVELVESLIGGTRKNLGLLEDVKMNPQSHSMLPMELTMLQFMIKTMCREIVQIEHRQDSV